MSQHPVILLHVCCAPCATHPSRVLREHYTVVMFFSNSNIHPEEEYRKRLAEARRWARVESLPLIEDRYDHQAWLRHVRRWRKEPEGGRRCDLCFRFNLGRAAEYCKREGLEAFTTTLTVSPHKNARRIFEIGRSLGPFLEMDFKKRDGFKRSIELSGEHHLYRQCYCGCEFSMAGGEGERG